MCVDDTNCSGTCPECDVAKMDEAAAEKRKLRNAAKRLRQGRVKAKPDGPKPPTNPNKAARKKNAKRKAASRAHMLAARKLDHERRAAAE